MRDDFIVDGWVARPDLNAFVRDGRTVRVEPKVMEVCVRLARTPGAVVTKAELFEAVWPDVVVGDDVLTRAISELRRALGDDARQPRVVETIARRGYRLIAVVEPAAPQAPTASATATVGTSEVDAQPRRRRAPLLVAGLGLVTVGLASWVATGVFGSKAAGPPIPVLVASLETDASDAELGAAATSSIERALERAPRLTALPRARVTTVLARMRQPPDTLVSDPQTAQEVAERAGGVPFVTGRVRRVESELVLNLRFWDAGGRPLGSRDVRGTEAALLSGQLLHPGLFEPLAAAVATPTKPLPDVTTSSLAALRLFSQAMETTEEFETSYNGPWDDVIAQLESALDRDPDFATARIWLAMILLTRADARVQALGTPPEHGSAHLDAAREAMAEAHALPEHERLFIEGVWAKLNDDPSRAIAALEGFLRLGTGLFERRARISLAGLYRAAGRPAEEVSQLLELTRLQPHDFLANALAAQALVSLDRSTARAAPYVARARLLLDPSMYERDYVGWAVSWLEHLAAYEAWEEGRFEEAAALVRAIDRQVPGLVGPHRDTMATAAGYQLLALGLNREARRAFERVGHPLQREMNLARLADLLDDRTSAVAHVQRMGFDFQPAFLATLGLVDEANAILRRSAYPRDALVVRGLELRAAGHFAEAALRLQESVELARGRASHRFYDSSMTLAEVWTDARQPLQAIRALEEAAANRPRYDIPGFQAAWWIKVQVRLADAYRATGRDAEAATVERKIRELLVAGDGDHPFLAALPPSPGARIPSN